MSPAEAALALGVRAQRPQEVHSAEIGPEGLAEVKFAVRALPEEEPAKTLLAGGPDHEVGIGLPLGVQVRGDALHRHELRERLALDLLGRALPDEVAHRTDDLVPAPVP